MERAKTVMAALDALGAESPAGYAIALHVSFTTPRFLFQTYEKEWMDEYSRQGFVLHDPTVRWGLESDGTVLWSDLADQDPAGVLSAAAAFGLSFGVTVATSKGDSKSVGSFARADREFDDGERARLAARLEELHDLTAGIGPEDEELATELRRLSVESTHG